MVRRIRPGADQVAPGRRGQDPGGGQHPGAGRHDHHRHAERVSQGTGVERPGAAEGDEGEAPRIDAPLHRDPPHGQLHVGVDDPDDPLRGDPRPGQGRAGSGEVEPAEVAERGVGGDPAEDQVCVGDGGAPAAPPIAGGTGVGTGRRGADDQGAAGVDPGDRSAARADRVHVERGHPDRVTADRPPRRRLGLTAAHQAYVGGGAAHVEGDGVGVAVGGRRVGRSPDAARGPRQQERDGPIRRVEHRHQPARRAHHRHLTRGRGESTQVAAATGAQHGVDDRGDRPLVLAELGRHLVRAGDVPPLAPQAFGGGGLVGRVEVGVEQADGDRLGRTVAGGSQRELRQSV